MPDRSRQTSSNRENRARLVAAVVGFAAVAMLGLSFAAVPLYRMYCAATGYAGTPQIANRAPAASGARDLRCDSMPMSAPRPLGDSRRKRPK